MPSPGTPTRTDGRTEEESDGGEEEGREGGCHLSSRLRPSPYSLTLLRPNLGEKRAKGEEKAVAKAAAGCGLFELVQQWGVGCLSRPTNFQPRPSLLLSLECARSLFARFPFLHGPTDRARTTERTKVTGPCLKGSNLA